MVDMMGHLTDALMVEITSNLYYHDHDGSFDGSNDGCFDGCVNTCNYIWNTYKPPKP